MAAKSADSARIAAGKATARNAGIKSSKAADAAAYGSRPRMVKNVVSQATINKIKSDGMTAALKKVGAGKASATYVEGVKRMYGASRIVAAKKANKAAVAKGAQNAIVSGYGYMPPKRGGGGRNSSTR
jgi:hypothetical protein